MWKKKKFLTMEEQVAKLSSKCRELTEEESRMLNGGGSNDYGGYNNWSEYAYAMSHEAAGDANKTWMPEKKETSSSNTDSTSSSPKNTGNGTNGNQSSLSETTITPTEDGNTDSIMGTTSSTNTGSQSSTTPKTPGYYSNTCTAAMLAEYKGKLEAEKAARDSVWDYYTKAGCPYKMVSKILDDKHKSYNNLIIKQKEIETKYGYDNALCYGTSTINLYRIDSSMTDEQVDAYFSGLEVQKYISKPDAYIKNFEGLSRSISESLGNDYFYNYIYPAENGRNILYYGTEKEFEDSSYSYGIGYFYKGTDYSGTPDHYELIVNNPYQVYNPGQQEYYLGWIYPLQKNKLIKGN